MAERCKRHPLVSRGGQLALYVIVLVVALLLGGYVGAVYSFMPDDVSRMLDRNGIIKGSNVHWEVMGIVEVGFAYLVIPIGIVAILALVGWGLCLFGLRRCQTELSRVSEGTAQSEAPSD